MEVKNLYRTIHWLEYSSFTFNSEYYVLLNNSLLVLQNDNHFEKVFFWGIIQCTESDYYIVFGYKLDAINDKKFYYSEDCQNWKLLPVPKQEHLILTGIFRSPFRGDPGYTVEIADSSTVEYPYAKESNVESEKKTAKETNTEKLVDQESREEARYSFEKSNEARQSNDYEGKELEPTVDQLESQLPITNGELKEEDRLAAIIHIISEETSLIPRGGLFKQTNGQTIHSRAFEGLQLEDADELRSFQHYRIPQQDWNSNLMTRTDYNYAIDFLDTIDKDLPLDCWTAQLVEGEQCIILRNLHWPGFSFFHHLTTPDHGFIYIGDGLRNLDIPFMTQVLVPTIEEEPSNNQSLVKISKTSLHESAEEPKETAVDGGISVQEEPFNEDSNEIITFS